MTATTDTHSVLVPAGRQALAIGHLWWIYFAVCSAIAVIVWLLVAGLFVRRHRVVAAPPSEARLFRLVAGAAVLSTVIVFGLLVADLVLSRAMRVPTDAPAITILVTGHQWWWSAEYENPAPHLRFTTANEIHIPVGRPVRLLLQSADVIHSFWAPSFAGKKDLVPGHPAELTLEATKSGVFRGQCAEFCGLQHAHMELVIVAQPPAAYAAWTAAAGNAAAEPATPSARRGKEIFLTASCVLCHTIEGTLARSRVGPDLTHLGSRLTLAAGAFPNTRGYLAGWILDAPSLKPGVLMPPNPLPGDDLQALLDYLESLR